MQERCAKNRVFNVPLSGFDREVAVVDLLFKAMSTRRSNVGADEEQKTEAHMTLRNTLLMAATAATLGLTAMIGASVTAQAADTRFEVGPGGVRIYIDEHGRRYYDRGHRHRYYYNDRYRYRSGYDYARPCHTRVSYRWRYGHRVRVEDRICYNRYGEAYVVDRDVDRGHW